jgi:hypothetical protein
MGGGNASKSAGDLCGKVRRRLAPGQAALPGVGERYSRVEVRS